MTSVLFGDEGIRAASLLLRSGKQVVMPTETVYGIAANALNFDAVAEIFHIKGRPASNPLIVHVSSMEQAAHVVKLDQRAVKLAKRFWPGPLTLVLPSTGAVASNVTAGGDTVGIRMPNHPVALNLLSWSELPLAAPSANRSEGISPTTVEHVIRSLGSLCPPILDGGDCSIGIESTVLDLSRSTPAILRPGAITREQIESLLGEKVSSGRTSTIARSPGMMPRHYAPIKPASLVVLVLGATEFKPGSALLYYSVPPENIAHLTGSIRLPQDPEGYATKLYAALHELDNNHSVKQILIEIVPNGEEWEAVRDRLKRATAGQSNG